MQTDPKVYKSIFTTIKIISKNEKILGFYKGLFANTLVNVPINSV